MKKAITMLAIIVLLLSIALIGCSKESAGENDSGVVNQEQNNGESVNTETEAELPEDDEQEEVTIRLASWDTGETYKARIAAFEEAFPHIKVEHDESITWPWNEALAASAAAGTLPDVLWFFTAPTAYQHEWAADLTPFLELDPEYDQNNIFGTLVEETNYNGVQVALPHSLNVQGVLLNLDLFEKENKEVPSYDWTLDSARELARAMTKANDDQYGFQNVKGARDMLFGQFDPAQGWATYDGEKFNFDSRAFIDTINTIQDIVDREKIDVGSLTEEERKTIYGEDIDPFISGKVAMKFDATWAFGGVTENAEFKWDFYPYPKVNAQRPPMIADYLGISSTSKHKEAAFEFVKFMTYSKEGWLKRIELENPMGSIPIINDSDVWEAYLSADYVPEGMKQMIPLLSDGFVDPLKTSPGYAPGMEASLWGEGNGPDLDSGTVRPEDVGPVWQELANKAAEEAFEEMNK
ncbi:ABC transporter substrate-binding protein [Pseudogracilibacillus auburnensis]|uniref:ABC transporter substrate-binding protein n=1 Tax=Pseudogracilibacillus auburnensis TaxID=1494959 RepID=UPI001A97A134|nr:extracellular solute-binding protein [Pseudogracilibacillus auburnensis]MBO1004005.1 extracellular solute-binding protein [Pseudogracilibacillus auburnensis]